MNEDVEIKGNLEIQEALKEFENKSAVEEVKKSPEVVGVYAGSAMARWVMKISPGEIKDERQAEYVLLGFVILAITVSAFVFFRSSSGETAPKIPASPFESP